MLKLLKFDSKKLADYCPSFATSAEWSIYIEEADFIGSALVEGRPFFIDEETGEIDDELNSYVEYLMSPRRRSVNTWHTYAYQVRIFLKFLERQGVNWKNVQRKHLNRYYLARRKGERLQGETVSANSWNIGKEAIVHLYEYGLQEGLIKKLPFAYRKAWSEYTGAVETDDLKEKAKKKAIRFIPIGDYKEFWRPLMQIGRNSSRNIALTDLLIGSGLRISEALSLKISEYPNLNDPRWGKRKAVPFHVTGKGEKERKVLIPKHVLRSIRFYIEGERAYVLGKFSGRIEDADLIFLSERGEVLTPRAFQDVFLTLSKKTGIKLTPHGCRHTFAIYQLEAMIKRMALNLKRIKSGGADAYRQILNDPLRQLQLLLGHSNISTTFMYLDFLEDSEVLVDESLADWMDWSCYES